MAGRFTAVCYVRKYLGTEYEQSYLTVLVRSTPDHPIVLVAGTLTPGPEPEPLAFFSVGGLSSILNKVHPVDINTETASPELVVWDRGEEPRYAYKITVDNGKTSRRYRHELWFDAETLRILEDRDLVYQTDVSGSIFGHASPGLEPDSPFNQSQLFPLPGATISNSGGGSVFSGIDGSFLVPNAGTTVTAITGSVVGQWVKIDNVAGDEESMTVNVTPPGPAYLELNTDRSEWGTAQVNTLIHTSRVHEFIKGLEPLFPRLDTQILADVNVSGLCTGEYSNGRMVFYESSDGCANSAYSTVIYHEYGHFLVESAHPKATADYHEAMADVTSAFLANDPNLFIDLFGVGTGPVRNLDTTTIQYPSTSGDPHVRGLALGGAFWETKKALAATIGDTAALDAMRKLYASSLLLRAPALSPQIIVDLLVLDDDDENILNGTPNYSAIVSGFAQHGLKAPDLPLVNFAVSLSSNFEEPNMAHSATCSLTPGTGIPDASTLALNLSIDSGPYVKIALGTGNPINVPFDARPCGTVLKWYLSVDTTTGQTAYYPSAGKLGPILTVYSYQTEVIFQDDFETNRGWTVTNTSVSTGAWERGVPFGTLYSGQNASPQTDNPLDKGNKCFTTGIGTANDTAGSQDLDGGPTVLTSPAFNLNNADAVVSFYSWFFCADATDNLLCQVSNDNGQTWTAVKTFLPADYFPNGQSGGRQWTRWQFVVSQYIQPTSSVRVRFVTQDNPNNSVTEAGLDSLEVTRFSCVAPDVTFHGRVELETFGGEPTTVGLSVQFRDPLTGAPVRTFNLSPDIAGAFSVVVPQGTYDIAVKGDRWLRVVFRGVLVDGSGTITLPLSANGDSTGDNVIDIQDMTEILVDFGTTTQSPTNLDGIGQVDILDLNIVMSGFGKQGEP